VPYLSALEVCSRQDAIQIHVCLYFTLLYSGKVHVLLWDGIQCLGARGSAMQLHVTRSANTRLRFQQPTTGGKGIVFRSFVRLSVRPSVRPSSETWHKYSSRDWAYCSKGFQGQRSKVKVMTRPDTIMAEWRHSFRCCDVEDHMCMSVLKTSRSKRLSLPRPAPNIQGLSSPRLLCFGTPMKITAENGGLTLMIMAKYFPPM